MSGAPLRESLWWLPDDAWLSRERLLAWCRALLMLEVIVAAFFVAGTHGLIAPLNQPTSTDFVSFYAAGKLADSVAPAQAYDPAAHWATEQRVIAPGLAHVVFYYPPVFLLPCALLAKLPYYAAFFAFELGALLLCLVVASRILDARLASLLLPILVFPPLIWNFGLGQNAFLSAALLGAGTLLIDRRPIVAGMLFGLLCYKPHFGLVLPFALLAGRHWRALLGAAAGVAASVGLSVAVFGAATWQAFLVAGTSAPAFYRSGQIPFYNMANVFGGARLIGLPATTAAAAQIAAILLAVVAVGWVWLRGASLPVRASVLASATALAAPLILFYDLMLDAVALVWLLRSTHENGHMRGERWLLVLVYALTLLMRPLTQPSHVPLALLATSVTFGWAIWRALRELSPEFHRAHLTISQSITALMSVEGRSAK